MYQMSSSCDYNTEPHQTAIGLTKGGRMRVLKKRPPLDLNHGMVKTQLIFCQASCCVSMIHFFYVNNRQHALDLVRCNNGYGLF